MSNAIDKDEITLSEVTALVWAHKWLVMAIVFAGTGLSVAYAKLAPEWWRAEVLLAPAEQKNGGLAGSLGALGGLANMAGINLDAGDTAEPMAAIQSAEFIGAFIEEYRLLPVLFASRWDRVNKQWKGPKEDWPDVRDGVRMFQRKILVVSEDPKSKLISVSVDWKDPVLAANWANVLVQRVNARMRDRAIRDAERNITYLRQELGRADVVTLQTSVARLLENEMQKMMVARGNDEYSFRVIDRAGVPKWRARPKRIQVVILGAIGSGMLAVFVAVWRGRSRRRSNPVA